MRCTPGQGTAQCTPAPAERGREQAVCSLFHARACKTDEDATFFYPFVKGFPGSVPEATNIAEDQGCEVVAEQFGNCIPVIQVVAVPDLGKAPDSLFYIIDRGEQGLGYICGFAAGQPDPPPLCRSIQKEDGPLHGWPA